MATELFDRKGRYKLEDDEIARLKGFMATSSWEVVRKIIMREIGAANDQWRRAGDWDAVCRLKGKVEALSNLISNMERTVGMGD